MHTAEQIIAHIEQIGIETEMEMRTRGTSNSLQGFDFMDVATGDDVFLARSVEIQPGCMGWVDFARSINAPVLFGDGFGQVIQPVIAEHACSAWTNVPKGLDCLTSCVNDIMTIIRKKGSLRCDPWRVTSDIVWHKPDKAFGPCHRSRETEIEVGSPACNRIQVLVPSSRYHLGFGSTAKQLCSPSQLVVGEAVIFGDSARCGLALKESYDAAQTGQLRQSPWSSMTSSPGPFIDSGIGASQTITEESERQQLGSKRPSPGSSISKHGKRRQLESDTVNQVPLDPRQINLPSSAVPNSENEQGFARSIPQTVTTPPPNPDPKPPTSREYIVGWLCAIKTEFDAALQMLDETYGRGFGHGSDHNLYSMGRIGTHQVVLTCLPMGRYGNNAAAVAATRMMNKFPNIKVGLMVGIGGGIPSKKNDIRLGDVVVSKPERQHGGVIQYDMGKFTTNGFEPVGYLHSPPKILLSALNWMPAHSAPLLDPKDNGLPAVYPGDNPDLLHDSQSQPLERTPADRDLLGPHVFYGIIASGNAVIKDASIRDGLAKQTTGSSILCFEMEAAGLMNSCFPCLVIRGISDYADAHKNDAWQAYAAAAAARYARDLLLAIPDIFKADPDDRSIYLRIANQALDNLG
ncbi:nucleoside phosphorylase domain-containing protein [Aspergillus multicolor]|uniref:5'-methylthioadenosine/S-adenosylhomocysteine nucleosidase family protein n=1 Tax=Aspergillus multicolor TaxID=41759 RepID=UPI003CCCB904